MQPAQQRVPGDPFNAHERQLLDLLCSIDADGADIARAQAAGARWGGRQLASCECFLIWVPDHGETARIPQPSGGPYASVVVSAGEDSLGTLDLWVVDGMLHSIDYMPFGEGGERLPGLHELGDAPF